MKCKLCGRLLSQESDPLSIDCGGDCWGCISEAEVHLGYAPSLTRDAVIDLSLAANWPTADVERGEPCEFASHPASFVVAKLDGLRVGHMGSGPGRTSGQLVFGYQSQEHRDPHIAEWESLLFTRLANIAEVDDGHAAMFMDEFGACYMNSNVHDAFAYMGASLQEALDGFFVNRRVKAMLRPEQSSVSLYGVPITARHPQAYDWRSALSARLGQ